jgi:hypothetical protein
MEVSLITGGCSNVGITYTKLVSEDTLVSITAVLPILAGATGYSYTLPYRCHNHCCDDKQRYHIGVVSTAVLIVLADATITNIPVSISSLL